MRATLRTGHRVHLVDDQEPDAFEVCPRLGGQEQKERLRRRDQDLGRLAEHRLALLLRRVARADPDLQVKPDAGERAAEVPLDVVVERLQRAHVQHLEAAARLCLVESPEECCERLPRSSRRLDQRVRAGRDGRPAARLRGCRGIERLLEPRPDGRAELSKRIHPPSVARQAARDTRRGASAPYPPYCLPPCAVPSHSKGRRTADPEDRGSPPSLKPQTNGRSSRARRSAHPRHRRAAGGRWARPR